MSIPSHRGPRSLSDILDDLFILRGYGRVSARLELERAWNAAVGEPSCRQTQLGEIRKGILNVTVAHSTLLEELVSFRKPSLLAALRAAAPATTIHDIRFRIGEITALSRPTTQAAAQENPARDDKPDTRPERTRRNQSLGE